MPMDSKSKKSKKSTAVKTGGSVHHSSSINDDPPSSAQEGSRSNIMADGDLGTPRQLSDITKSCNNSDTGNELNKAVEVDFNSNVNNNIIPLEADVELGYEGVNRSENLSRSRYDKFQNSEPRVTERLARSQDRYATYSPEYRHRSRRYSRSRSRSPHRRYRSRSRDRSRPNYDSRDQFVTVSQLENILKKYLPSAQTDVNVGTTPDKATNEISISHSDPDHTDVRAIVNPNEDIISLDAGDEFDDPQDDEVVYSSENDLAFSQVIEEIFRSD